MTRTRWIIFIVICLGILSAIIFVGKNNNSSSNYSGDPLTVITEGPIADHVFGSDSDKVVLIEYGDFQCPGCGSAYPIIKEVTEEYSDQLTFVFRNLPLTTIHPNALAAATAAEAAGLQGKYFEYHDLLYASQNAWKDASVSDRTSLYAGYAEQLGLNVDTFTADLTNSTITDKINRDRSTASTLGIGSTPTFLLNGEQLGQDIAFDKDKLKQAINDELTKAGIALPSGK